MVMSVEMRGHFLVLLLVYGMLILQIGDCSYTPNLKDLGNIFAVFTAGKSKLFAPKDISEHGAI